MVYKKPRHHCIFFQLFDAQVKPMLLYASEILGMTRLSNIEKVRLFACKRLLSVSEQTPNRMVYGETGRYTHIDNTISVLSTGLNSVSCPVQDSQNTL